MLKSNYDNHSQSEYGKEGVNMTIAFVGGTVIVYAFVMKHVLKHVTH